MSGTKLRACKDCSFYSPPAPYDHECSRFASIITGETEKILCCYARSKELPEYVALPHLDADSCDWAKSCGPEAWWFSPAQEK
jgi:hypothetical protein